MTNKDIQQNEENIAKEIKEKICFSNPQKMTREFPGQNMLKKR